MRAPFVSPSSPLLLPSSPQEDHLIQVKGANAPLPARDWDEMNLPRPIADGPTARPCHPAYLALSSSPPSFSPSLRGESEGEIVQGVEGRGERGEGGRAWVIRADVAAEKGGRGTTVEPCSTITLHPYLLAA